MKRIIILLTTIAALSISTYAEDNNGSQKTKEHIKWEIRKTDNGSDTPKRIPLHIDIDAIYNNTTNSIEIIYSGETEGEVFLYDGDNLINYSSTINTTLPLPSHTGSYTIEIVTDSWVAQGFLQIQ